MAQQPKQEQVNKPISRPKFDLSNNTSNASGAASQNTRNSQPENSQPLYMDFEIIWAWIANQHTILHDCRDPAICELPLDYDQEPAASNTQMDGERLRRSPRKHGSTSSRSDPEPQTEPESAGNVFDETDTQQTPRPPRHGLALRTAPNLSYPHRDPEDSDFAPRSTKTPSYTEKISNSRRPTFTSGSRTGSSVTSRTRSTSPIKKLDDLSKLEKPVKWESPEPCELKEMVEETGSAEALRLFNAIWDIAQDEGFLPRELKELLKGELMVKESKFATEDRAMVIPDKQVEDASKILPSSDDATNHLMVLCNELTTIRQIVNTTKEFVSNNRSEATWNDHIHGPTLRLAVSNIPEVEAENITTSAIERTCIPPARGDLEALGGKMIDYAFLLRPDKALETRITNFVAELPDVQSFNQSTHGPLCKEPTGVLIETKVESKRQGEGKTQLGIWLASWFGRVAKFEGSKKLPFLPVILVVCENWELYFAFNKEDRFEVCGPVGIGNTKSIEHFYQLLAVLRLLGGWMRGEFRDWVEHCVS
ncbi:uncharacterized protein FOBCDRAFT_227427 [Fusarium oxysporum Fo47]|uniref:PD-(D/E)XK nuclease-like domain-containing protein n=1 Tax=Fusarium oxysporum Fo47 TaxID=660027 RepID=W9J714_FUSOX|nr:uncharacterized protein FOBCDRAFT_227427 [Fusarium oxysporum Fo47]EWZ27812.1 hypothetical protein FOZG_18478 [Fusarium oxysporum Fo47]QKD56920.1 hypothetical protein FOBCDRAFT_227427 [Fusarium oxysporum Fo47]